jgi:catechol 2,3-dioxygenase-like lactoylglutathione lyase family enzyme
MLASAELVAFVPVADLGRARSFYENILGIPCVDASRSACVFNCAGTTLRATLVEGFTPVKMERYEGVEQDDRGIWTTPAGDQVVWFKDFEGNTLSLTKPVGR